MRGQSEYLEKHSSAGEKDVRLVGKEGKPKRLNLLLHDLARRPPRLPRRPSRLQHRFLVYRLALLRRPLVRVRAADLLAIAVAHLEAAHLAHFGAGEEVGVVVVGEARVHREGCARRKVRTNKRN